MVLECYWGQLSTSLIVAASQNTELKAVLAGAWPDIGLPPQRVSAGYYLFACAHYLGGECMSGYNL